MEYCDSDETMTASESEMEVEECQPQPSGNSRRLTYAEIVKSGLSSSSIVSHNSGNSTSFPQIIESAMSAPRSVMLL